MQTLKIEIPTGYEIDSFDKSTGDIKFKPKPKQVTERIMTVGDILADNGLTHDQFSKMCDGLDQDETAYRLLKLLAKSLNEGWTPDWKNSSQVKYYPYFEMESSSGFRFYDGDAWGSYSFVGSRLCYKTRELAEHAGNQFLAIYRSFMVVD
jgi:hypothetical protein